ncbi:MAG: threonine--tRNA ligase [Methylacidiphilales bacterium]|nr:threonine--tRNA ligase [Candidatus Methylacidiphilales bacterium]
MKKMTPLEELRHSASHILATAVLRLFPDTQLDIGPPTDTGFYYDFDTEHPFTREDLDKLEREMEKIASEKQAFERSECSRAEAEALIKKIGQDRYKLGRLKDIPEGEAISFYRNGEFVDLCAGTHLSSTAELKAFKLLSVAGAYHRGDEKNKQLQRIYGTAFPSAEELKLHLEQLELAKQRDHRKLGKELQLFTFEAEEVGPGLPLWLPNGTVLIEELEKLAKETEFAAGYQRVRTPHIARDSLYHRSGHLPYYAESMFPPMEFEEEAGGEKVRYYLKAMNCPHHHKLFGAVPRSYRDLPLRFAEYGTCYRYEQSGELFGLMRVRSMQMNDAHIYCSEEQFAAEFKAVNEMYLKYFKIFGFEKYRMRYSTHDPAQLGKKFVDQAELWKKTETMVREVLVASGIDFVEVANEAAFYGPKIDVQVWSAIGREFTIATNQVDFAVPARFGLEYTTAQNSKATPLCIHRAPLGTHERFIGFLIEHFGGAFPVWLSPEQVRLIPITDNQLAYAHGLRAKLHDLGIRCAVDDHPDKMGAKIRRAQVEKVPYMLVIGAREMDAGKVAVRSRGKGDEGSVSFEEFLARIQREIQGRELAPVATTP